MKKSITRTVLVLWDDLSNKTRELELSSSFETGTESLLLHRISSYRSTKT